MTMGAPPMAQPTVATPAVIESLPCVPLGATPGVEHVVLWHDGISMAGLLTVPAGTRLGQHSHGRNHHHMWVLEGRAVVFDDVVMAGTYVHIPAGVPHDLDATHTEGCRVFYLYIRPAD